MGGENREKREMVVVDVEDGLGLKLASRMLSTRAPLDGAAGPAARRGGNDPIQQP